MPTVSMWLNDDEFAECKEDAVTQNLSVSAMLKQAYFNAEIVDVKKVKSLEIERNFHLNRIGNNVNQVAKYCNSNGGIIDQLVLSSLMEIQDDCKTI